MSEYSSDLIKELVDEIDDMDKISKCHAINIIKRIDEHITKIETQNKELIEEKDMLKDDHEKLCNAHTKLHELYSKKTLELAENKESKEILERDNKISSELNILKDKKIEELFNVNIDLQRKIRILEENITESHKRQIALSKINDDILAHKVTENHKLKEEIKELQDKLDSIIIEYTINIPDDKVEELVSTLYACIHDKSYELKKYKKKYKAELTKNNAFTSEVMDILEDMNDLNYRPDHYKLINVETLHKFKCRLEGSMNRALGKEAKDIHD